MRPKLQENKSSTLWRQSRWVAASNQPPSQADDIDETESDRGPFNKLPQDESISLADLAPRTADRSDVVAEKRKSASVHCSPRQLLWSNTGAYYCTLSAVDHHRELRHYLRVQVGLKGGTLRNQGATILLEPSVLGSPCDAGPHMEISRDCEESYKTHKRREWIRIETPTALASE